MSELKKFTIHLHATYTPIADPDGEEVAVVMGDPEVTECETIPGSAVRDAQRQQGGQVSEEVAGHEVARITITRTFTDDGDDLIGVDHSDDITAIEALGMLEIAKETWSAFRPDDDEGL